MCWRCGAPPSLARGVPWHARSYKSLKGSQWTTLTLLTALLYPGVVFFLFFFLNFFIWGRGSSAAVPFGTLVALIAMWFCISVPLVFLGAFFGPPLHRRGRHAIAPPCRLAMLPCRAAPMRSLCVEPAPLPAWKPFGERSAPSPCEAS